MKNSLRLSAMPHTWILDLDGTIVKHNGYKTEGIDTLLPGAAEFMHGIPESDLIIFITSRKNRYKEETERFLTMHGIRFDVILYGAPCGERILINDNKPSGLRMAYAAAKVRDSEEYCMYEIDREI